MEILFINPNPYKLCNRKIKLSFLDKLLNQVHFQPALTFPMLAAMTSVNHSIKFLDELNYKDSINFDEECDLVGITCKTYAAPRAYELADEFRRCGKTVVLGGYHPSALPEEAKQHADAVVIGEAEDTWPQLLKDFENDRLKPFYEQEKPVDLRHMPTPRRDIFGNKYSRTGRVETSRGCPVGCKFCAISNSKYGRIFRTRSIEDVIKEIKSLPGKFLFFYDSALTIYTKHAKQLFRAMKELDKKFYALGNISLLGKDEELLKLASEAGSVGWNVGFDSVCQESLKNIHKNTNKVENYKSSVKKIHDYGMEVNGSFIFGFDNDKLNIFDETLNFVYDADIDWAAFQILTPLPGTPLFTKLDSEKRVITKDWSKYDFEHVVFQPKNMTPDELLDRFRRNFDEFNTLPNQLKVVAKNLRSGLSPVISKSLHFFDIRYRKQYGRYWK